MESIGRVASGAGAATIRATSPLGEGVLAIGQTVNARVTRVEGDTVQLRWGDQTLNVASRVPLDVGQQVRLLVEEGGGGKMLLRMVDDTFGKGRPPRPAGPPGRGAASTPAGSHPGQTVAADGDPLSALLFESPDGSPGTGADQVPPGGLAARAAMPTYGKLAQSVGGAAAFGQLLANLGAGAGQPLARAPLAPSDLGRLLVNVGIHPDEMNAVLVSEMLAQGVAVNEAGVRRVRRDVAAARGSLSDAAPAVALNRLGLPITPLSLAIARQLQAGQLDPKAVWGELLGELQTLAREGNARSMAGMLASELLAGWRVPVEEGAEGISRWLRNAVDQAATPLEAKLARAAVTSGAEHGTASSPSQDVRARLDLLSQAMLGSFRTEQTPLSHALQRTQATIQAEQFLNGASTERAEQRFFAVTLPTVVTGQQPSTLELRVREREARSRGQGGQSQPDVVQMKLSLPGLGDLGINLMVGQHSVSCHFSAGSPFAEALINASSSQLVGRLKRLGFAHTAVDVAHEPPEPSMPPLAPPPRMSHVDVKA